VNRRHRIAPWTRLVLSVLFLIVIVVQFLPAGYGSFEGAFGQHEGVGWTIGHFTPLLILVATAVLARGGTQLWVAIALGVLGLIQPILADAGSWAGVVHPLNALVMFLLAQWLARHDRRLLTAPALPAPGATAPAA